MNQTQHEAVRDTLIKARDDIQCLERENAALRAWKESALAVERELNAQTTAKLLGARLGESCHKAIAEKVPQLVAENVKLRAELVEVRKAFAPTFVAEMHAECINLERENAELRELAARMATEMREVDHEFASLRDYDAARKEAKP